MTRITTIFLLYTAAVGTVSGLVLVMVPRAANGVLRPYFWILIALLVFEAATYLRGHGAPGTMITMGPRMAGFLLAMGLMLAITMLSGTDVALF